MVIRLRSTKGSSKGTLLVRRGGELSTAPLGDGSPRATLTKYVPLMLWQDVDPCPLAQRLGRGDNRK